MVMGSLQEALRANDPEHLSRQFRDSPGMMAGPRPRLVDQPHHFEASRHWCDGKFSEAGPAFKNAIEAGLAL